MRALSTLMLLTTVFARAMVAQDILPAIDADDAKRTTLYMEQLDDKQAARLKLQHRAEALSAYLPSLQNDIQSALQDALATEFQLRNTPELQAVEHLGFTGLTQGYRNPQIDDRISNQPGYFIWYSLQDNTLYRQQLFLELEGAAIRTQQGYEALRDNRKAFFDIAQEADANFLEFHRLADLMGRRSASELKAARERSQVWLQDDPKHAGAMLIHVYCLRNEGRFDECERWLTQLDRNYPTMEAIHAVVAAQIAYVSGDDEQAFKYLDRAASKAAKLGIGEPYLIRGWLSMANKKWARAKQDSSMLYKIAPKRLETSVLHALAIVSERPKSARDAMKILRDAQLRASQSDWYYQEALGIVQSAAGDRVQAIKALDQAIANAPSHLKQRLTEERDAAAKGNVPTIDWRERLLMQWRF
jgi:hypothetical protein